MSDRKLTCAQRIRGELASREAMYADLWRHLDAPNPAAQDDENDAAYQELEPLGMAVRRVVSVQLIWGGPADWLEIELENADTDDIRRVTYHFADWFDHAERDVTEQNAPALWRAAEYYSEDCRYNLSDHLGGMQ